VDVAQRGENAVRTLRVPTVSDDRGIRSLPIPEAMKLGIEDGHISQPGADIWVNDSGDLSVTPPSSEDLAKWCRRTARTMPLNSKEQREMLLKASFYELPGDVLFKEGAMYGSDENLRRRLEFMRDRAKHNLTPEQEEFLSERD
jgi:hypothetical protein